MEGSGEGYWLGHRERLRLRAEADGLEALRPHELLELVLFYAVPRVDTADVARALMERMGSVRAVFAADRAELMSVPGVTGAMADWIMMTGELMKAYARTGREDFIRLWRFRDVLDFIVPRWRQVPAPQCWMIYTDFDDRLITYSVVCDSLSWTHPQYVRDLTEEMLALQVRHAFLVLFMGVEPLELDREELDFMVSFSRTLRAIDVELMDCVLVGEAGFVSLNLEGKMEAVRSESTEPALYERYREGDLQGFVTPEMLGEINEEWRGLFDEQDRAVHEGEPGTV